MSRRKPRTPIEMPPIEWPSIVLVTGMSGSGKSVALHALEDAGYFCVDNLPPELLADLIAVSQMRDVKRLAIAIDIRSRMSLPQVPQLLDDVTERGGLVKTIFLDAHTETLMRRFSETRRRHPLSGDDAHTRLDLMDAIEQERTLLEPLHDRSHTIDTSMLKPSQLQSSIKSILDTPASGLTLVFESFGFKRGVPLDADYVFDVRMLPNPHYEPELRPLTGCDTPVAEFLAAQPEVHSMQADIESFLRRWLQPMQQDHRSYVTVAIGCTGGQHRSVFLVEALTKSFASSWNTVKRHRDMATAQ